MSVKLGGDRKIDEKEVIRTLEEYVSSSPINHGRFTQLLDNLDYVFNGIEECLYWDENGDVSYGKINPRIKQVSSKLESNGKEVSSSIQNLREAYYVLTDNDFIGLEDSFKYDRLDLEDINRSNLRKLREVLEGIESSEELL